MKLLHPRLRGIPDPLGFMHLGGPPSLIHLCFGEPLSALHSLDFCFIIFVFPPLLGLVQFRIRLCASLEWFWIPYFITFRHPFSSALTALFSASCRSLIQSFGTAPQSISILCLCTLSASLWSLFGFEKMCPFWSLFGFEKMCLFWSLFGFEKMCPFWSLFGFEKTCPFWSLFGFEKTCGFSLWLFVVLILYFAFCMFGFSFSQALLQFLVFAGCSSLALFGIVTLISKNLSSLEPGIHKFVIYVCVGACFGCHFFSHCLFHECPLTSFVGHLAKRDGTLHQLCTVSVHLLFFGASISCNRCLQHFFCSQAHLHFRCFVCCNQHCAFCLFSDYKANSQNHLVVTQIVCQVYLSLAALLHQERRHQLLGYFVVFVICFCIAFEPTLVSRFLLFLDFWVFHVFSLFFGSFVCIYMLIYCDFGILQSSQLTWMVFGSHGVGTSVSFLQYWVRIVILDRLSRSTKHHHLNACWHSTTLGIIRSLTSFISLACCRSCQFGGYTCTSGIVCKSRHRNFSFCRKGVLLCHSEIPHWGTPQLRSYDRHIFLFWHFASIIPDGLGDPVLFTIYTFNSTMGFPGEGPTSQNWSCISANVNSIHSHPHVLEWEDDVVCIQETRISETNISFLQKSVKTKGRHIYHGTLIKETRRKNGHKHTPHGGVACIAPEALSKPLLPEDDSTGLWDSLLKTSRVTAIWTQILPKVRCLIFSFYGQTSMECQKHIDINDDLLQKIFSVAAQFGEIPILVTGDLQADPDLYQAVVVAKGLGWVDPISGIDHLGNSTRPITYSRSSDFLNPTENFSSIDAVLLNRVAATALKKCEILHTDARQHAPIRVSFTWERILQDGFVLQKPAAFDLTDLPKNGNKLDHDRINSTAQQLWFSEFQLKCSHPDSDQAWNSINDFAVKTLVNNGAKFQKGLQTRGTMPQFKRQVACPGQMLNGSAATYQSARLSKLHKLISELNMRLSRPATNHADFCITLKLQNKLAPIIPTVPGCQNWNPDLHMNQVSIAFVQKSLQSEIIKVREKEKRSRISAWRKRMIFATQNRNVDKSVYKWIKEKNHSSTPNLITNSEGNVIFSPTEALQEINEQWDEVFSANIHHEDPEKVLYTIWPYIKDSYNPVILPPLNGESLKKQCLKRKINAAAGLDGWRTIEVQSLPICVFEAVSSFFTEIETGNRDFPQALTCVKQVLLDKNGGNSPTQKRIISLMSVFVVTYTGLRYAQLHTWQSRTLPKELYGGIKGRKMSEVYSQLQLQIDQSFVDDSGLIGLKLDKSKCFDRLVPSITAALFVGFGLPVSLTMFFTKFYNSQKRFLAYKEWTSEKPTTACNGLIQGCSLSLLAINLHMTIWVAFMKCISNLHMYAFIDDSYLWVRYHHADALVQAVNATQIWDQIVGQALNVKKCQSWATNHISRNKVKEILPEFEFCEMVVVLGARIQTTLKKDFQWPAPKTQKILRDIELIKTIPCGRFVHEHLISSKVIPQLSFASHINSIPKAVLIKIQNQIADVLWKGRPSWRAKGLLLGILARPHRCDPITARAFNTLFDCFTFLKQADPLHRQTWTEQFNSEWISPNSLIAHVFQACEILGIELVHPFHITAWMAHPVSILDFAKRDIKAVLVAACRHAVYHNATRSARKDLSASCNFLDFPGTCVGNKKCADIPSDFNNLVCYRDSVVVGCVATNDRRSAAGMCETKQCRYCGFHDETFSHLATSCCEIPIASERPPLYHEFGPNFLSHGIVEIEGEYVQRRLTISDPSHIPVVEWDLTCNDRFCTLWTDGSCDRQSSFWFCCGAFAIIGLNGELIADGDVHHWSLSSYSCELWAILVAFFTSSCNTECVTDCLSVHDQFNLMVQNNRVDPEWSHLDWWNVLFLVYSRRKVFSNFPLSLRWCPAHKLEHLNEDLITESMARDYNTTRLDIIRNRQADKAAKRALRLTCFPDFNNWNCRQNRIAQWQVWLAKIAALVGETSTKNPTTKSSSSQRSNCKQSIIPVADLTLHHGIEAFQHYYPKWDWCQPASFPWQPSFNVDFQLKSYAAISNEQWKLGLLFFNSVCWVVEPGRKTAFTELAFLAWDNGWNFPGVPDRVSAVASFLKKICNQASKNDLVIFPGCISTKHKSLGKTLPAGFIDGAWCNLSLTAMKALAIHCLSGRTQTLASWDVSF